MTVGDRGYILCDAKETTRLIERVLAGKNPRFIPFIQTDSADFRRACP